MNQTDVAREDLMAWLADQPDCFYTSSQVLRELHQQAWSPDEYAKWLPGLTNYGRVTARDLDPIVAKNNKPENLPRLEGWDGIGLRSTPVEHHPTWHEAGRLIYGSGVMASYAANPQPHRYILSLFYLSCHVGEGGHNCPLACTAGAIRALTVLGTPEQKSRYLKPLLDRHFDTNYTGAQFLTELQGGSDVGANATVATPESDGTWRIRG